MSQSSLAQKLPTGSTHVAYTMAGILALGGVVGYAKSKSVPSLVAGLGFASLYGAAGVMIGRGQCKEGHATAALTSAVLAAVMGRRFAASKALFPAGLLAGIAVPAGAYDAYKARQWYIADLD